MINLHKTKLRAWNRVHLYRPVVPGYSDTWGRYVAEQEVKSVPYDNHFAPFAYTGRISYGRGILYQLEACLARRGMNVLIIEELKRFITRHSFHRRRVWARSQVGTLESQLEATTRAALRRRSPIRPRGLGLVYIENSSLIYSI